MYNNILVKHCDVIIAHLLPRRDWDLQYPIWFPTHDPQFHSIYFTRPNNLSSVIHKLIWKLSLYTHIYGLYLLNYNWYNSNLYNALLWEWSHVNYNGKNNVIYSYLLKLLFLAIQFIKQTHELLLNILLIWPNRISEKW